MRFHMTVQTVALGSLLLAFCASCRNPASTLLLGDVAAPARPESGAPSAQPLVLPDASSATSLADAAPVPEPLQRRLRTTFGVAPTYDRVKALQALGDAEGMLPEDLQAELARETLAWLPPPSRRATPGADVRPSRMVLHATELSQRVLRATAAAAALDAALDERARAIGPAPLCPAAAKVDGSGECSLDTPPEGAVTDPSGQWAVFFDPILGSDADVWVLHKQGGVWAGPRYSGIAARDIERFRSGAKHAKMVPFRIERVGPDARVTFAKPLPADERKAPDETPQHALIDWPSLLLDRDHDGWSDLVELRIGTQPTAADTDGDGTPDARDPSPTCKPVAATTRQAQLSLVAMRHAIQWARPDVAPYAESCIEVPTVGPPLLVPSNLEALRQRLGLNAVRVVSVHVGAPQPGDGPDDAHLSIGTYRGPESGGSETWLLHRTAGQWLLLKQTSWALH